MHRKMLKHWASGRRACTRSRVLSDCAVYPADGPSPLDFLPHTADGKPLPGGFRLGVIARHGQARGHPGLLWAAQMLDEGPINPARHIKGDDAALDTGE